MDRTGMIGINATLLLLLSTQIAAYVPPVTNVTLSCRNFNNILYWNYTDPSLAPRFRVDVRSLYSPSISRWVDSPNLHDDVSFLKDVEEYYSLTVTAVVGENESDPSPAINFSYYEDSPADQICFLDLPLVNVTVQSDHTVGIRFPHPSLSYPQLPTERKRRRRKKQLTEFTYIVIITNQREHQPHDIVCDKRVCEETLSVEASKESPCVKINGRLGIVSVRATQDYCAHAPPALSGPPTSNHIVLYILCPLLGCVCVICLVSWMVYRKWTSGSSSLPAILAFTDKLNPFGLNGWPTLNVERTAVSPVQSTSPGVTPLLPTGEGEEFPDVDTQTEPDVRLRIGVMQLDRSLSSGLEERLGEGEGYESGKALDVGEGDEGEGVGEGDEGEGVGEGESSSQDYGSSSGYEQRPKLVTVEITPGDKVKGYRG